MSLNQIVTPLDSAVLENREQYKIYFQLVQDAFGQLVEHIADDDLGTGLEARHMGQYCDLLMYSLEAFRIKYLFSDEEKMRIDLTESGFPNYLEFRYLYNDLKLKKEHLRKLPDLDQMKQDFLDRLLKEKQPIPDLQLHQAASLVYYSSVEAEFVYKRFVQGKVIELEKGEETQYMVSWSFYDLTLNRPFICFMYFDLYKEDLSKYRGDIYKVLNQVGDRAISLEMMGYAIDKRLPNLWPKRIRRIDLGPLHTVFAKDELKLTHVLLKAITEKVLPLSAYALALEVDEIHSTGNFAEGSLFSRQYLQLWGPNQKRKFLLTQHRTMQTLYDKMPSYMESLTKAPLEIPALKLD